MSKDKYRAALQDVLDAIDMAEGETSFDEYGDFLEEVASEIRVRQSAHEDDEKRRNRKGPK